MSWWTWIRAVWAKTRGATVLITPNGDGYAAYKGSGVDIEQWAESLRRLGWRDF